MREVCYTQLLLHLAVGSIALRRFLHSEVLSNRDKNSRKAVHKNQSYSLEMSEELLEAASNMEGDGSITELSAQGITDMAVMMLPEKYQVCMVVDLLREQKGNHGICSDRWQPPSR